MNKDNILSTLKNSIIVFILVLHCTLHAADFHKTEITTSDTAVSNDFTVHKQHIQGIINFQTAIHFEENVQPTLSDDLISTISQNMIDNIEALPVPEHQPHEFFVRVFGIIFDATYLRFDDAKKTDEFSKWRLSVIAKYLIYVGRFESPHFKPYYNLTVADLKACCPDLSESQQDSIVSNRLNRRVFLESPKELLEVLAGNNCKKAQEYVAQGYAEGKWGFMQNPEILIELGHKGWEKAQEYVAQGYAEGKWGFM
ncbi:MAG: hypothetical protein Q8K36_02655, partial [Alphaproteobacteria bacterium]|nr:hypothetical protein [Alphaproteobacteria bacterium]